MVSMVRSFVLGGRPPLSARLLVCWTVRDSNRIKVTVTNGLILIQFVADYESLPCLSCTSAQTKLLPDQTNTEWPWMASRQVSLLHSGVFYWLHLIIWHFSSDRQENGTTFSRKDDHIIKIQVFQSNLLFIFLF